jgi:hypothetical protein
MKIIIKSQTTNPTNKKGPEKNYLKVKEKVLLIKMFTNNYN